MSDEKTYQPGWGEPEHKHRHHHHHHDDSYYSGRSSNRTNAWGGWLKQRDRQAYYGLMLVVIAGIAYGTYTLVKMFADELRAMPKDDPRTEMKVDELRIRKVDEQEALVLGDSLAQAYNVDSMKRNVQIETRPVYRPPRREDKWYITKREWKRIWADYKVMRWERKHKNDDHPQKTEDKQ